jgi:signal transduction histidine kinase
LLLHSKLLLNVLTFYYRAKLQEQKLLKQAHMQAIYETGSKLTHDVKNILQSTQTMTQIINDNDTQMQEKVDVIKKQMPLLTQRLNTTLEKLRAPASDNAKSTSSGSLLHWWNQLQLRYTGRHIEFSSEITNDMEIPLDIFTTVTENLLDNARNKRSREPELKIFVTISKLNNQLTLSVIDTGSTIPQQIYPHLFKEIVSSNDGFGIGLYQCYELADSYGYKLSVENNEDGNVRFILQDIGSTNQANPDTAST